MNPIVRIVEGRVLLPTGAWEVLPDVHRDIRGHDFYPPFPDLAGIPALGSTANVPPPARTLHIHYSIPTEQFDWYVAELDPATGQAFGWLRAGGPYGEWGDFILGELEAFIRTADGRHRGQPEAPQLIQRDTSFRAAPAALCLPAPTI
ncbi:hypothetical protein [Streptomyces sp. NBRC 110465]|uniref:hypothetical protein n=1 Tax=Streptomyces sp. NBRC 110465 TaxID=1897621 RepID=UPI000932C09B|nr:hypothetical protein [Streptomyces sp. NBRC 110465]